MSSGQSLCSALSWSLLLGLINIYSSQLGRKMSGRGDAAIVTEGSEMLMSQQGPVPFLSYWHSLNTLLGLRWDISTASISYSWDVCVIRCVIGDEDSRETGTEVDRRRHKMRKDPRLRAEQGKPRKQ